MSQSLTTIDHSALKTNQACIIGLLLLAFLLDSLILVTLIALTMLLGSLTGRPGFLLAYRALRRLNLIKPDLIPDHPEPHRFAQSVGAAFLIGSVASLALAANLLAWVLAWLVIALAALNLFVGFCVGCALYYWLNRLGLPGFTQQPPAGTKAGWRPKGSEVNA